MKKYLIMLMAAATLLPVSCSKESGSVNEQMTSGKYEYSGKMTRLGFRD